MGVVDVVGGAAGLMLRAARIGTSMLTATDGRDVLHNDPDGWEVDQPWLWWAGPAGGNGTGGPFGNPIPGAGTGYEPLTGLPAVGRATSLIVDTIAGLPWKVYRGTERLPTPDWINDPQALRLDGRVVSPGQVGTARWSAMDLWAQWLTSALWWGDGYVWTPSRDAYGNPKPPLYVLNPRLVTIEDGRYFANVGNGDQVELGPDEVIHLRGLEPIHKGHGSGVLTRYAGALGGAAQVRAYADGVYTTGVPSGYLKSNQPRLDQPAADNLKAQWMDAHGKVSRSIAVLNATTEFVPLTFNPVDAELISMLAFSLQDVANAFGVPGHMLGAPTDQNTYANIESRMTEFVRFTILPWSNRLEAVLAAQFPRGTDLKVAIDGLQRADTSTRYAAYKTALDGQWLTVDEVRAYEDLPPLDGGAEPATSPVPTPAPTGAAA